MSLEAPTRSITGLIGPNGAGKSTTFNVCSGFLTPASGRVELLGDEVTHLSPQARAQRGLGRTFQRMQLCEGETVRENVSLGWESRASGSSPLRQLLARKGERTACREAADRALDLCGLHPVSSRTVGDLSTGQRRLVELARAIAGGWDVLLLDEPSSGLDKKETFRFGEILRDLAADGRALLLVEHDMALVMSVCDYVYVLDFGKPLFEGTPADVASSDVVRAAYLGSEAAEVA
ncbi:MAG TPA: ABC transporter ATP-binding protein [Mycobacteriales bacterium]|nr:ABC transporter ATP-binding protein [Mycobacteriales bacterium]